MNFAVLYIAKQVCQCCLFRNHCQIRFHHRFLLPHPILELSQVGRKKHGHDIGLRGSFNYTAPFVEGPQFVIHIYGHLITDGVV